MFDKSIMKKLIAICILLGIIESKKGMFFKVSYLTECRVDIIVIFYNNLLSLFKSLFAVLDIL